MICTEFHHKSLAFDCTGLVAFIQNAGCDPDYANKDEMRYLVFVVEQVGDDDLVWRIKAGGVHHAVMYLICEDAAKVQCGALKLTDAASTTLPEQYIAHYRAALASAAAGHDAIALMASGSVEFDARLGCYGNLPWARVAINEKRLQMLTERPRGNDGFVPRWRFTFSDGTCPLRLAADAEAISTLVMRDGIDVYATGELASRLTSTIKSRAHDPS